MKHDVIVPSPGESITEVFVGVWQKRSGDFVKKDDTLVDLETQKTTFDIQAEYSGQITVLKPERETKVKPGEVIAIIDDSVTQEAATATGATQPKTSPLEFQPSKVMSETILSPAARKIAQEKGLEPSALQGSGKGGRVLKEDVLQSESRPSSPNLKLVSETPSSTTTAPAPAAPSTPKVEYRVDTSRGERIQPATRIRRQIAQNLVAAQHTAAILTTFNECDMSQLLSLRQKHKEDFKKKHGVSLGIVSFFALAAVRALKELPQVNATFTGEDIISRDFVDLSVAVSTESGLVVPVIRNIEKMSIVEIEKKLADLTEKARSRKLSIAEMTGGTFSISNGGVFGSLLSTPILNMPQSAILGLHKTEDRPVVVNGEIVIRPMMYLALSYDHRLIDGREAVTFLVKIKEGIENLSLILTEKDL
jgi:2-oxoglutarate dehydrogenase E2 component (dihydrolipoamide succinyltransferase)